jgi:glucose-6-phosphate dehydrogenase assembly protein OpcA
MSGAGDRFWGDFDWSISSDLQRIEQEIARLWYPDASSGDPFTSLSVRASALNLVVVAPDSHSADLAQDAAERLSQIHPCRVIIFQQASGEQTDFRAEIYASCEADGEQSTTPCIERIRIPVYQHLYEQLPSLVQPLIIPELPAFLWWPGKIDLNDPALVAVARAANVTIFDSLHYGSAADLILISEIDGQLPSRTAIADLNWHRLMPWRELTAQFFDIRSVYWALSCIREVEIDVGRASSDALPAQAVMLASWLAHCLGWRPVESRRTRIDGWHISMLDQYRKPVKITIRSRPDQGYWAGHVLALSMNAQNTDGQSGTLNISRSRESSLIRMYARVDQQSTINHAVYHPLLPDEALLVPVLEAITRDHVFESSLEVAVEALEAFGNPEV